MEFDEQELIKLSEIHAEEINNAYKIGASQSSSNQIGALVD